MNPKRLLDAPIVQTILKRRYDYLFAKAEGAGCYRGVFRTFEDAARSAPENAPVGYDTAETGEMYRERITRVFPSDYPMLFWLREVLPDARRVFDFGGHVGIAYYAYQRFLRYPAGLSWTVCDVPAVVDAGASLARERGETALRFTTSFPEASGASVLIAAGSLQYVDQRLEQLVAGLAEPPVHILVNKTPTHATREFVTLQNIGVTFCPYRIAKRGSVPESLSRLGYVLVDTWENAELRCVVPFDAAANPITYVGYYLRLQ